MNRRTFVKMGMGAAGTLCLPLWSRAAKATAGTDPHFFVQLLFQGGMDPTYLFDARPLAMTQAGVIQNYLGEDPTEWLGSNGQKSWATKLTNPLKPYRDRFSVLNGVVMATGFDGHDQNTNFLLTGDPFGGESFVPHLNRNLLSGVETPCPLDAVMSGSPLASLSNTGSTVPLNADSAAILIERLKTSAPLGATNPLYAFIRGRMDANGLGDGVFSVGSAAMKSAYDQAPAFAEMLKGVQVAPSDGAAHAPGTMDPRYLKMCLQLFKQGVTRSAMFVSLPIYDAHGLSIASTQPTIIGAAAETIASVFKILSDTPYDGSRSFLDVTTVMVASEFGRTLRQKGVDITKTGTDHNPLSNSIILGGKGIRGGQVIGESDTRSATEQLSKVHTSFDPASLKMMGKPFDFAAGRVRTDLPETYNASDYLGMSSVANTLYKLFGVSPSQYRKLVRNGLDAPVVPGLIG